MLTGIEVKDRFWRLTALGFLGVAALFVAQPYVDRAVSLAAKPAAVEPRGSLGEVERAAVNVFDRVSPSVVQVTGRVNGAEAAGTGFAWDIRHIVTNGHVVQGMESVGVRLASGETIKARVVASSPTYDLAVLRISGSSRPLPPVAIGSSADLKVGQTAYAIGNPFGLQQSLTTGVISALKRRLPSKEGHEITDVIQTDAAINPGSSGGPLVDSAGRLIGVTTAIYSPSGSSAGVGFALPVETVNRVVPQLIRGEPASVPTANPVTSDRNEARRLTVGKR